MAEQEGTRAAWPGLWSRDKSGPYLVGGRCEKCARLTLGLREFCPHCHAENALREERVGRSGEIYSATVIAQGPAAFKAPYRVGYVDIEDGVRIFAHLDQDDGSPAIGQRARLEIRVIAVDKEGRPLDGPFYVGQTEGEAA